MDEHLQGVDGFRCCNKQDVTLFSAKTDVGSPFLGNWEMGYLLAVLIEDGYAVTRKIDVPAVVDRHPVRTHVGKHLPVRE